MDVAWWCFNWMGLGVWDVYLWAIVASESGGGRPWQTCLACYFDLVVWYYFVMTCFVFLLTIQMQRRQCCLVAAESSQTDFDNLLKLDPGFVGSSWLVPVRLGQWWDLKIIFDHFLSRCLSFHPFGKSFIKIAIGREPQGKSTYLIHQIISM